MARSGGIVFTTDLDQYAAPTAPIGQGGSGVVYLATGSDGQPYAIKVLDPHRATSAKLKRFTNELNFGRRVRHDNIVPVLDSGIIQIDRTETPFFVMPHYSVSLRSLITTGMAADRALTLFDGIIEGLGYAHARSVWHRDVKPENVLYDEATDRLLLGDFGIAHFEEDDLHTAVETRDAERLANFMYAAPEQRQRGAGVDHRADIYAAGLILNEMITGRVPQGTAYRRVANISARHAYVDTVVDRAIRSDPSERYNTVGAIRTDLRLLSAGSGLSKARSVGSTVTAAKEKERLFRAPDGIEAVHTQVAAIYDYVEDVLKRAKSEHPSLQLESERAKHEIVIRTARTSARINWYQAYGNVLDEARLTIWTYKWRLLLPAERSRFVNSVDPEEMSETIFRPDYTAAEGLCWSDETGKKLSVSGVGDRMIEAFFDLVQVHENSDEQPY